MKITIDISDPGEQSFDEIKEFLNSAFEDNGIDADTDVTITEDEKTGDPNDLEDKPLESAPGKEGAEPVEAPEQPSKPE